MVFQDKDLTCRDCSKTFVFSGGEQEFFSAKGLVNEPKRCPNCRILMRVQRSGEDPNRTAEVACAECGSPTRVPFQPKGYRPVYCSYCFRTKKLEGQGGKEAAELEHSADEEQKLAAG
ncbi:MAG: zinc-ribbon domain containing protein [Candidatus Obscuribacterales bacterium]|nr:zinc-ribbon domain containing protein [Candidatus Obscuribacterales bacterium]